MAVWEYEYVQVNTNDMASRRAMLDNLGSLGWEVCGWASVDRTIGLNAFVAIMKRQAKEYLHPNPPATGWHKDPSDRHEMRFFDGVRWTEHISDAGVQGTDYPTVRA
ncbi:MAG: DUF2510 domain-containing protein [Acidimicrobiia bacterium]